MSANEVLVLLTGDEGLRQCPECFLPPFAVLTEYFTDTTHFHTRSTFWCVRAHSRVVVSPPQRLDDEMRDLLT